MAIVSYTPDPKRQRGLSAHEKRQQDALIPEQIEANALADPDNPPLTKMELARVRSVAQVRRARAKAGLSQARFAAAYHISLGRLKDLEQGRRAADSALLVLFRMIEDAPRTVAMAAAKMFEAAD